MRRDFGVLNSYSLLVSQFGYHVKLSKNAKQQFYEFNLIMFGKELVQAISQHLEVEVTEMDLAEMVYGYDIQVDYGLYNRRDKSVNYQKRKRLEKLEEKR